MKHVQICLQREHGVSECALPGIHSQFAGDASILQLGRYHINKTLRSEDITWGLH